MDINEVQRRLWQAEKPLETLKQWILQNGLQDAKIPLKRSMDGQKIHECWTRLNGRLHETQREYNELMRRVDILCNSLKIEGEATGIRGENRDWDH